MKEGTRYAERLRKAYARIRPSVSVPTMPDPLDPIRCLATAVLGGECGDPATERWIDRIFTVMVDWNEVRVSNPLQVAEALVDTSPEVVQRCQRLVSALRAVFNREHKLSLDRIRTLGRREARQYLESLDGVDGFAVASVVLWCFGGHAIPVSDRLLEALRKGELVNPAADRDEVQAFLERNVPAAQAGEFSLVMRSYAPAKRPPPLRSRPAKSRGKAAPGA